MANEIMPAKLEGRAMDRWARGSLLDWAAGRNGDAGTKERLGRELDDLAASLAGPNPSPVERVLAETAALCWSFCRTAEVHLAYSYTGENGPTLARSDHDQKRVDRAHRRLLRTLTTLATVRRLAVPALQVNIGARQFNVAGMAPLTQEGGAEILDAPGPDRTGSGPHE